MSLISAGSISLDSTFKGPSAQIDQHGLYKNILELKTKKLKDGRCKAVDDLTKAYPARLSL